MNLAAKLKRDFSPFVDPATDLQVSSGTAGIRLQFLRNAVEHDYFFDLTNRSITARHAKGRKFASLRSLLASSDFADIRGLAATQVRMFRKLDLNSLIPPEGEINSGRLTKTSLAKCLAPQRVESEELPDKIDVVLIDGPAGVGKTSLIESVMVQRARRQNETGALPPILHVASRGRRLTGLNDALAQSIQLIRAKFTYDQAPVLIRHNLLQVAIDGFDELVDPEGYKDAWFALKDFFEDVICGGPIILAGRDTFFDQQNFLDQIQSSQHKVSLTHIRLQPSTPSTARDWLKRKGWSDKDLNDPYTNIVLRPGSYALRPYFLSQLASAKSWAAIEGGDLTPRSFLVENFIIRESKLLSAQLSAHANLETVRARLSDLFEEIALEMADNEVDSVDLSFLQLVTEVSFAGLLERHDLAKLQHKAGSFALLETDSREGYRRFPHTEISNHFLASALIKKIVQGAELRFLRRGATASDFLAIFGELFCRQPLALAKAFVDRMHTIFNNEASFDRLSENVAALLIGTLCYQGFSSKSEYSDLTIVDAVLFGVVAPAKLTSIRFQRLDIREAELADVEFEDCEVSHLTADDTSRFGRSFPSVHRLLLATDDGRYHEVFEPEEISTWIHRHSIQADGVLENKDALKLFDRVCRVMLRQHMIKEHPSDPAGKLLENEYWKPIEAILSNAKLIERLANRGTSGAAATFIRMADPFRLLVRRFDDPKVKAIWTQIGNIPN